MIKLKNSLAVAQAVLTLVMANEETENVNSYVEVFDNCREQGYKIITHNKKYDTMTVCFSENRNSDSIVIYHNKQYEAGTYSDEFWNSRKYFNHNQHYEAAEYIVKLITDFAITGEEVTTK